MVSEHSAQLPTRAAPSPAATRIAGLSSAGAAYVIASLEQSAHTSTVVIVPDTHSGELLVEDLRFFLASGSSTQRDLARPVESYFGSELLPFEPLSPSAAVTAQRLRALTVLREGRGAIVVATIEALLGQVVEPSQLAAATVRLKAGTTVLRDDLISQLLDRGYTRSSIVEEVGQVAARGSVIDIFPPGGRNPVRIELFGDTVDGIRSFDSGTQRSIAVLDEAVILPMTELLFLAPATKGGAGSKAAALTRVRARASDLRIPQSAVRPIEEALEEGLPYPGLEQLAPLLLETVVSPLSYLPSDGIVVFCDEISVRSAADDFESLVEERAHSAEIEGRIIPVAGKSFLKADSGLAEAASRAILYLDRLRLISVDELRESEADPDKELAAKSEGNAWFIPTVHSTSRLQTALRTARSRERPFAPLAEEIVARHRDGVRVAIVVSTTNRVRRLEELLAGYDILAEADERPFPEWMASPILRESPAVTLLTGRLSEGMRVVEHAFMLIPEREIFPETIVRSTQSASAPKQSKRFLSALTQLQEDDFVVHIEHGVAIYRGLRQIEVEGKIGDFLHLEYADEAKLFLPVDNIGKLQRYRGIDGKQPTLSALGGKVWVQAKRKVKENVAELAGQLLNLLAEREIAVATSYGDLSSDDRDFAASFPFDETPDQQKAIDAILEDLGRGKPMDRLVCGDVGYGKTEVALRAAFKVVNGGAQVAVLVPTTILAEQHYQSFKARFADSPIRVAAVSRFNSSQENREILEEVRDGKVDIVIGTHRLVQKDVHFKNLGLVVIDEEHRFGVAQKERLKRLRAQVHVLTLTATPIPRTLHMSLVGMRDLSVIETPPTNRQATRTYLATYSPSVVREAILRELNRGGQVFYIYNRVENIAAIADEISEIAPQARVGYGHGQLKDRELEEVMHKFIQRELDVLVSTTIVESGLDIPNANTIIIRNAHLFGLAELYQLRGRVGRGARRAYAYLLIPEPSTITGEAKKRLQVLQSLDDLGVGFRLALQDMEIRGAGNLLGKDQSGHIASVGFELYTRILSEAVQELKQKVRRDLAGEAAPRPEIDPDINIGFPSHIPQQYVPDVSERLILYQRMIAIGDEVEAELFAEELNDRFGRHPGEVQLLLESMVFRGTVRRAGVTGVTYRQGALALTFHPDLAPDRARLIAIVGGSKGRLRLTPAGSLQLRVDERSIDRPKDLTALVRGLFQELGVVSEK